MKKKKPCHMWCTPKSHYLISIPYLNLYIWLSFILGIYVWYAIIDHVIKCYSFGITI